MQDLVEHLSALLKNKNWKLATAESCTGGLLGAAITHRPGSSDIYECGFITYSNQSKISLLKIPESLIKSQGAVSAACAEAMAKGVINHTDANLALSITGIAGPGGGSETKPVGLVFVGYAVKSGATGSIEFHFEGNREQIRASAATAALRKAIDMIEKEKM